MFKNSFQSGFLTILYAAGAKPLSIWDQTVMNGHIRRVTDEEVQTLALEVMGTNVATTYISCPADKKQTLGIRLPFFVMIVKNMNKYFTFEIQILDDKNMSRRFRVSNYQSTTRVRPFSTSLPIGLTPGWNQIQFNLADFTRRAYGSTYLETLRVHIHANIRIRRIYFSDRLYTDDELPLEFRLYVPMDKQKTTKSTKGAKGKEKVAEREEAIQLVVRQSMEKSQQEIYPSGVPPSPVESTRADEPEPELLEFIVEKQPPVSEISTEGTTQPEQTQEAATEQKEAEEISEAESEVIEIEDEIQQEGETSEQEEVVIAEEVVIIEDDDVPEASEESETVSAEPLSEPEQSEEGPSEAELSEALADVAMEDSEAESELEEGIE